MRKILAFILTGLSAITLFGCSSEPQQYDLASVMEKGSIVGSQSVQLLTESIDSVEILQQLSAGLESEPQTITLTIVGDCLLASDFGNVTKGSFAQKALEHDWTWFLGDAARYFETDDFTIVNLENVLTDDKNLKPRYKGEGKAYWYKAPTENTNILMEASVEVVDLPASLCKMVCCSSRYKRKSMESVYIVTKATDVFVESIGQKIAFTTNEGVFTSEQAAKDYIKRRKAARDRDDRGCRFAVEPWNVQ